MPMLETPSDLDQTLMAQGESRVTELARPFGISLNAVSKHIRMLERAQLVRRRRSGRDHFLSINAKPLDDAALWIETQRVAWSARLDALDAVLKAEDEAATEAAKTRPPEKRH
jgi:DNA-binding transcriptional ArsR family regulator